MGIIHCLELVHSSDLPLNNSYSCSGNRRFHSLYLCLDHPSTRILAMTQYCPACGNRICPPRGSSKDLLIVGEFPGKEEMSQGRPFATSLRFMTAGQVFKKELERLGVSLNDFRLANLWLHEPTKSEDCFQAGYNHVLDEAKGKSAILLVGSDVVEVFTGYKVSDVSGLQVASSVLSAPIIYAMVNPALALHRALGEVRHGVQKFVARLEKEGLV